MRIPRVGSIRVHGLVAVVAGRIHENVGHCDIAGI